MSGSKMRECLSRRALLSGTAAGAKAIAVDDAAEPEDAGEESDALAKAVSRQISIGDFRCRIRPSARQFVSKNSTALAHPCGLAGRIEFTLTMPGGGAR
jgi:hypothetical protein